MVLIQSQVCWVILRCGVSTTNSRPQSSNQKKKEQHKIRVARLYAYQIQTYASFSSVPHFGHHKWWQSPLPLCCALRPHVRSPLQFPPGACRPWWQELPLQFWNLPRPTNAQLQETSESPGAQEFMKFCREIEVIPQLNMGFGWEFRVQYTTTSMLGKFVMHAWRWCGGWNKAFYISSLRVKLKSACQMVLKMSLALNDPK